MSNQVTPALSHLAAARADFAAAGEKAQAAHAAHSALLVRLTEAQTRSAAALTEYRAGKIDEATASLRKASADADAQDLQTLIDGSAPVLASLDQALTDAQSRATQAEAGARKEEHQIAAKALDAQIAELEKTFLAAIGARYQLHIAMNSNRGGQSTFTFFRASQALDALVRQNAPPSA
jgi:hypothetical protein